MQIEKTSLEGVFLITPKIFADHRGSFRETYRINALADAIFGDADSFAKMSFEFVQGNESISEPWTVRGLHFQLGQPQGKLVHVVKGGIFDVAVDIRQNSPNFRKWVGVFLDDQKHQALYVPPGFAHGFVAGENGAIVSYQCTTYFDGPASRELNWLDPEINIEWPIARGQVVISEKDKNAPFLNAIGELP